MSVRDNNQPYMVYEGPLPRRPALPEPLAADIAPDDEDRIDAGSRVRGFAVGLVVVGALAMGVAIGLWAAPNLRGTGGAPQPEQAPLALSLTQPTEAPLRDAIELPAPTIEPAQEAPPKAEPVKAKSVKVSAKPPRARQAPQRARQVAHNTVAASKAQASVRMRAPRAELADWLAGEQPATHTPAREATGVHEDPVGELIATAGDPPHL